MRFFFVPHFFPPPASKENFSLVSFPVRALLAGLPGGPIFGLFDRFFGDGTGFDRFRSGTDFGTDLRILGPILASAEISEEMAIFVQIFAILCRFSEIFASGGERNPRHMHNETSRDHVI